MNERVIEPPSDQVRRLVRNFNVPSIQYVYNTNNPNYERVKKATTDLNPAVSLFYSPNDFEILHRLHIFKFLFQDGAKAGDYCPPDKLLFGELQHLLTQQLPSLEVERELFDVMWTFHPKELNIHEISREYYRQFPRQGVEQYQHQPIQPIQPIQPNQHPRPNQYPRPNLNPPRLHDIARDSQNVHDSGVAESVRRVAVALTTKYTSIEVEKYALFGLLKRENKILTYEDIQLKDIRQEMIKKFPSQSSTITSVFDRIDIDTAQFLIGKTLADITRCLWIFIKKQSQETQTELYKRFMEEIIEMKGYCATGYISRLLNVFQGYTDDVDLMILTDSSERMKIDITDQLNKFFAENEDAADDILDPEKFTEHIITYINTNMEEIKNKYNINSTFKQDLLKIIKEYSKVDAIKINCDYIVIRT